MTSRGNAVLSAEDAVSTSPRRGGATAALPWPRLLPALLTGGLLYACHFPLAWGWLGWVALVPLLALVRSPASGGRVFLCAWAGGLVFFWAALQWMRVADVRMYATWAMLATYCALYIPLAVLLTRRLDRRTRLPLVVTFPAVWVALEFLRSHLATGFGWYLLGHTQHDFLAVIQVTDLGGAYAVSLLVAAVNAVLFELLYARPAVRAFLRLPEPPYPPRRLALRLQVAAAVVLGAGALAYGGFRLSQSDFAPGPRVALVQSNLDIRLKNEAWSAEPTAKNAAAALRNHHERLSHVAAARRPDLIVWPETSCPEEWVERDDGPGSEPMYAKQTLELMRRVAETWRLPVLVGLNSVVVTPDERVRRYNSAVLIGADGRPGGRYDKIHCVPFGEYVPLRDVLPWMKSFAPYDFDYSVTPGERLTRFRAGDHRFGVLICYEDTVTYLARRYTQKGPDGPPVDFLLNTSNDGWFDGTAEHEEHLAVSRFRAVEARRTVARSVNMGISAVIDPNGRVLAPHAAEDVGGVAVWDLDGGTPTSLPTGRWAAFKKTPGVVLGSLPIDGRVTLYARWGDWLPWGCWSLVSVALAASFVRRK